MYVAVKLKKGSLKIDTDNSSAMNLDVVDFKSPFSKHVDFGIFSSRESRKADAWLRETEKLIELSEAARELKMSVVGHTSGPLMSDKTKVLLCRNLPEKLYGKGAANILENGAKAAMSETSRLQQHEENLSSPTRLMKR